MLSLLFTSQKLSTVALLGILIQKEVQLETFDFPLNGNLVSDLSKIFTHCLLTRSYYTVRQKKSHFLSPCSHGDFSFPWG